MKYIMCAKTFPAYHPKAGQPTGFRESILTGRKIHTLRQSAGNRKTGDTVSLREWAGRPYGSRQVEFARCQIHVSDVVIRGHWTDNYIAEIARMDGFSDPLDFAQWFGGNVVAFDGVCIYFEDVQPNKEVSHD